MSKKVFNSIQIYINLDSGFFPCCTYKDMNFILILNLYDNNLKKTETIEFQYTKLIYNKFTIKNHIL